MKKYKLTDSGVQRPEDGACIPDCVGNRDWDEYQIWLTDGNTPDPMDLPPEPTRDENVSRDILEAWPIEKQVEALVDNAAGDTTKLDSLKTHIEEIKVRYPVVVEK